MKRIVSFVFVGLLLLSGVLASCAKSQPTPTIAPVATPTPTKVLKIGVTTSLSGPGAPWGLPFDRTARMFAEDVNAKGGINVGGVRYKIELISYDDKYSADESMAATTKLIFQDGVKYVVGTMGSALAVAQNTITNPNKVILVPYGSSPNILGPNNPYTFRGLFMAALQEPELLKWIAANYPNVKNYAYLGPNDETGWSHADLFPPMAEKVGWKVVAKEFYERGTKDFYPLLTKVLATRPDIIDPGIGAPGDQALIVKQARELGYKGVFSLVVAGEPGALYNIAGKEALVDSVGTYPEIPGDNLTPEEGALAKRYLDKYGPPASPLIFATYATMSMLTAAMEKAGTIDTGAVKDVLQDMEIVGVSGRQWFSGEKTFGIKRQMMHDTWIVLYNKGGKPINVSRMKPFLPLEAK